MLSTCQRQGMGRLHTGPSLSCLFAHFHSLTLSLVFHRVGGSKGGELGLEGGRLRLSVLQRCQQAATLRLCLSKVSSFKAWGSASLDMNRSMGRTVSSRPTFASSDSWWTARNLALIESSSACALATAAVFCVSVRRAAAPTHHRACRRGEGPVVWDQDTPGWVG